MIGLFITVVNMSIAASIVAIAVMLVRLPLKRTPKIFSYALWAVVFLRLVCPISIESSTSLMPVNAEPIPPTIFSAPTPRIDSGIAAVDGTVNRIMQNALSPEQPAEIANPLQTPFTIGAYVWLGGVIIFILYTLITYGLMKRRVFDATLRDGNMYETDKISTAFILGFVRPKIYVPTTAGGGEQLDYILKHEQVHIRRRDYLIKPLAFLVLAVHWFNPIVWISYYLMTKDMEMSCDEAVLRKYNEDVRQAYSLTLVNLYTQKTSLLSPLAFGEGNFRNMKERLKNVLKFRRTPRWVIVLCSFLLVMFLAAFTTNPPKSLTVENPVNNLTTSVDEGHGQKDNAPTSVQQPAVYGDDYASYYSSYYNSVEYQRQWQSYDLSERAEHRKSVYQIYEPYGLTYDTSTNRLYLNGELVRYFADIWGNPANGGVYRFYGPYSDGTMIVTAQRNSEGELTGLSTEAYRSDKNYDWETVAPDIGIEVAEKIRQEIRETLRDAYAEEYGSFGLLYDVQTGRLHHDNNLVQYFEDKTMDRHFGAYIEGEYTVYAIRDNQGNLTGLQVENSSTR